MQFEDVWIPYGAYWTSPFCAWQGSFASLPPIPFAADLAARALRERGISADDVDGMCFGTTVPSRGSFYAAPWFAGLAGLCQVSGPTIHQACATSVRCLVEGAQEVATGGASVYLAATADRTSNGPHVFYPNPAGPGGTGESENPVLDSFKLDPYAGHSMVGTAENVAREAGIDRAAQEELTLLRYAQYERARAENGAFQGRYMLRPVDVRRGRQVQTTVSEDEGVHATSAGALGALKPVVEGGTVTFGTQTHPADGSAGVILVRGRDRARAFGRDEHVTVRLLEPLPPMTDRKALANAAREAIAQALTSSRGHEAL